MSASETPTGASVSDARWLVVGPVDVSGLDVILGSLAGWCQRLSSAGVGTVFFDRLTSRGEPLDPFVVAAALSDTGCDVGFGAILDVGAGRSASLAVRELTTLDHLARGRTGLLLRGVDGVRLAQAAEVVTAMLSGDVATAGGDAEFVIDAPNRPGPFSPGGPEVRTLLTDAQGGPLRLRTAADASLGSDVWCAVDDLDVVLVDGGLDGLGQRALVLWDLGSGGEPFTTRIARS